MHENFTSYMTFAPLSNAQRWLYVSLAFVLVAFGQPASIAYFGLIAAMGGYALFWRVLIGFNIPSQRFRYAALWFFGVQLVQLAWFISHPYLYIYAVYLLIASLLGVQFGLIGLMINPKMINNVSRLTSIAAVWTLLEWSRLFLLSGFSFNPIGIALGGSLYPLQTASLWGVFGLSFWVIFTNLLALRAWLQQGRLASILLWLTIGLAPYVYGIAHIYVHEGRLAQQAKELATPFRTLLVQTAFPVEEAIDFNTKRNMISFVSSEWRQILDITKKHQGKAIDLIALPEFVVPFGTYANVYAHQDVLKVFQEVFGSASLAALPPPEWPLGALIKQAQGETLMVNNAFWVQSMANIFQAAVIAGLEDAEDLANREREYYSAALLFQPQTAQSLAAARENPDETAPPTAERYEKRILVPMGEYIPFSFCQELAKQYGVFGSFTPGKAAKVMSCGDMKISPSICYEETFGDLMREGRQKGADMLVNLTSDVWYPNSQLPVQHLEHARFRTVENGIPLIRACNTGVTSAIDSLGRNIAVLGGNEPKKAEWLADALYVEVPTYHYPTLYSQFGDKLIIGFSLLIIFISVCFRRFSF